MSNNCALKCWAVLLSISILLPLYAQVQSTDTLVAPQENGQQATEPALQTQPYPPAQSSPPPQSYQQPQNSDVGMPVTFSEAYLQSDQSKYLYKAGNDIHASILWSLFASGLSVVNTIVVINSYSSDTDNSGLSLVLSIGSITCSIIAIVKTWQSGTKLQKASGRVRD